MRSEKARSFDKVERAALAVSEHRPLVRLRDPVYQASSVYAEYTEKRPDAGGRFRTAPGLNVHRNA